MSRFVFFVGAGLACLSHTALAGTVSGKLELPAPPERPPSTPRGFLDRSENPLKPPQPVALAPYMFVVLEGKTDAAPPQVTWELLGESFAHPVTAAMAGAEVVIKNSSKTSHTLTAVEDKALLPPEPINPAGPKSFKAPAAGTQLTIHDPYVPYFWGKLVIVASPYIGYVEDTSATAPNTAKFEIPDVPEGTYKLRVYYRDGWLDSDQTVKVDAKGKTELPTTKIAALAAKK